MHVLGERLSSRDITEWMAYFQAVHAIGREAARAFARSLPEPAPAPAPPDDVPAGRRVLDDNGFDLLMRAHAARGARAA